MCRKRESTSPSVTIRLILARFALHCVFGSLLNSIIVYPLRFYSPSHYITRLHALNYGLGGKLEKFVVVSVKNDELNMTGSL